MHLQSVWLYVTCVMRETKPQIPVLQYGMMQMQNPLPGSGYRTTIPYITTTIHRRTYIEALKH